uniref:Apyrase n=1 Tax=Alexandrium monilatum TaxID=311494 RepID=A0A7S4SZT8_9DINO
MTGGDRCRSMSSARSAWRVAALVLVQHALFGCSDDSLEKVRPKYARVQGTIETVWQRPHGEPKGIFFIAHGCMHQSTDIFTYEGHDGWKFGACNTSNLGKCLGLPEEVRMRQVARQRGYVVVAVSGGRGRQSCWDLEEDGPRVEAAIKHVRQEEGLAESLPVFATGASSGGAFMGALVEPIGDGGLPGLRCIVPMIMGLHGAENSRKVPTLFVHMPKDTYRAVEIRGDIERLRAQGVRVAELQVRQRPVTLPLLQRCLQADVAEDVLEALRGADLLDAGGFLKEDSRRGQWVSPASQAIAERSTDTLMFDESCLAEEMNLAWAAHEFASEFASRMLDFCEGGGVSPAPRGPVGGGSGALRGAIAGAPAAGQPPQPPGTQQVLVFDAGSSGTRVHVFNMLPPQPGAHVPKVDVSVRDKQTLKIKPGLSHFARANDINGAEKSIQQLLDFANTLVPAAQRPRTPALLKATAGLRAVSETQANLVLAQVRQTLDASGYSFRDSWADIIIGKEEAGLAWVAANYLQGTFDGSGDAPSLGIIEMGGGSTQVSFQVDPGTPLAPSDSFVFLTALGRRYHVYAHSYLGYGQDYAQAKMRELLPKPARSDPCYPPGYSRPAASGDSAEAVISGGGNASGCAAAIDTALFKPSEDAPGRYFGEQPLKGKFLATQNFFYVRRVLGLPMDGGDAEMEEASRTGCRKRMELPTKDPGNPNTCFGLSYQVVLLRSLRVPTRPGVTVEITNSVKGGDADWALGAAIVHVLERLVDGPPSSPGTSRIGTSWMGMFAGLAAASLLAIVIRKAVWPRLRGKVGWPVKQATSPPASYLGKSSKPME